MTDGVWISTLDAHHVANEHIHIVICLPHSTPGSLGVYVTCILLGHYATKKTMFMSNQPYWTPQRRLNYLSDSTKKSLQASGMQCDTDRKCNTLLQQRLFQLLIWPWQSITLTGIMLWPDCKNTLSKHTHRSTPYRTSNLHRSQPASKQYWTDKQSFDRKSNTNSNQSETKTFYR